MTRLLLVEDDHSLGETLKERLEKAGYAVDWAETKASAETLFRTQPFTLVILDVGLPDGSGFELAKWIQKIRSVPMVFMTAMNTAENRLEGYEIGAAEFIPKPFHLKELLIRVSHVLETHRGLEKIVFDDRYVDFEAMAVVHSDGRREALLARDFQLLKLLTSSSPKVLSRDEILDAVWGEDKFPSHRTVDNAIVRLRQALGEQASKSIRSVRGVGYQWVNERVNEQGRTENEGDSDGER